MEQSPARLYLCGGTQSSGSTLVSWCFLQRSDMDGVLDADNDLLPAIDRELGRPFVWYKTTVSCFRLGELIEHYEDDGWNVQPLLVVRDVRRVWASLASKPYGSNGITAEDPPLRMRLRRFKADWELFRRTHRPVLRYEGLLADPERTLREACRRLGLAWDEAMLRWPKQAQDIADARWGNHTFWTTRGKNLAETISRHVETPVVQAIPTDDLNWLESEFREFNVENHYPLQVARAEDQGTGQPRAVPRFEATRRYEWETRRKPIRWLLSRLGVPYRKLIERRSWKRAG